MSISELPPDPLEAGGLGEFARSYRRGETTSEAITRSYLDRIRLLDGRLGAFEHVADEQAIETARAMDALLAAGTDLGSLMGVPVAVKDLFVIEGMPLTAGSNLDVSDLVGGEGSFVSALRRAGLVLLGKTRTDEFALGTLGYNPSRGSPWNPWESEHHLAPGGSSSGSAVAVAAGMCAVAFGTDTGGSIRGPAAFCGIFGLKTTAGRWPTDGLFPLSPTMDTVGINARSAADAALTFETLSGDSAAVAGLSRVRQGDLSTVRLGVPRNYFFDDLDPHVERSMNSALDLLAHAGANLVEVDIPEASECPGINLVVSPAELLTTLGSDRFLSAQGTIGEVAFASASTALEMKADTYIAALRRHGELCLIAGDRLQGFDAWITPTRQMLPMSLEGMEDRDKRRSVEYAALRNTRPANTFGLCATSLPVTDKESPLPVGLQLMGRPHAERELLTLSRAIEELLPPARWPDSSAFLV
ncbi:MAG: amidase [Trueperaceae bacterium]